MHTSISSNESFPVRLISVDDAAKQLGVSPWTIRSWIRSGVVGSVKLGSRTLLETTEVSRLIDENRRPAVREATAR